MPSNSINQMIDRKRFINVKWNRLWNRRAPLLMLQPIIFEMPAVIDKREQFLVHKAATI